MTRAPAGFESTATAARPSAIDLFSGAGGMSLGFEQAGFDVLVAVDNDPVHLAVHERNFPLTETACRDAAAVGAEELLGLAGKARSGLPESNEPLGTIDCVFGGPSCQGFSSIGRRNPNDPRNSLLIHFARIVEEIRPRCFVMENVPGLLEPAHIQTLRQLMQRFERAGYVLGTGDGGVLTLNAADFGVPQRRKRIFIVGMREGEAALAVPKQANSLVTVGEALNDLPDVDDFEELAMQDWADLTDKELSVMTAAGSPYARSLRQAASGLSRPRDWDAARLTSSARTLHTWAVRKRFTDTPPGSEELVSRSPRLKGTAQSGTLRAGTGRDHGSFSAARPIHHQVARVITVREAARLHSFPDWFRMHVTKWHGFRQVGNAVPPLLARAVAERLVEGLGYRPTAPTGVLALGPDDLLSMSLQQAADHFGYERSLLPPDSRLLGGPGKRNTRKDRP